MSTTNNSGVQYIGDSGSDGTSFGKATTSKSSCYGVTPVVQATTISAQTASVTTTDFNLLLTAVKNFGIVASA